MANRGKFSLEQRIHMVILVSGFIHFSAHSLDDAVAKFNLKFPGVKTPDKRTFMRTYDKFLKTGTIADSPRSGRPRISDLKESLVENHFQSNRFESLRKATRLLAIAKSSLYRVLKRLRFHPYKLSVSQLLRNKDKSQRQSFCEYILRCLSVDKSFLRRWLTSDEACFSASGMINRQNCRVWAKQNPHLVID